MKFPRGSIFLLVLLYGIGLVACAYLVTITFSGSSDVCKLVGSDCAAVVQSPYGSIAGFSVASFGLAYFTLQLFLILSVVGQRSSATKALVRASLGTNVIALFVSGYFLYLLYFVFAESCVGCLTAHFANIAALISHFWLRKKEKHLYFL